MPGSIIDQEMGIGKRKQSKAINLGKHLLEWQASGMGCVNFSFLPSTGQGSKQGTFSLTARQRAGFSEAVFCDLITKAAKSKSKQFHHGGQ